MFHLGVHYQERCCVYTPNDEIRTRILFGWSQSSPITSFNLASSETEITSDDDLTTTLLLYIIQPISKKFNDCCAIIKMQKRRETIGVQREKRGKHLLKDQVKWMDPVIDRRKPFLLSTFECLCLVHLSSTEPRDALKKKGGGIGWKLPWRQTRRINTPTSYHHRRARRALSSVPLGVTSVTCRLLVYTHIHIIYVYICIEKNLLFI